MCVSVYTLIALLLGCQSQAELHDRKSKIPFQIVFLLFLVLNSQVGKSVCICVCVLIKGVARVSTVSASRRSSALPKWMYILKQCDEEPQRSGLEMVVLCV